MSYIFNRLLVMTNKKLSKAELQEIFWSVYSHTLIKISEKITPRGGFVIYILTEYFK